MAESSWPPLDLSTPPETRAVLTDLRLRELKRSIDEIQQLTPEQHRLLIWLIDFARGSRLLWKGGAWAIATVAALAGLAQATDVIAKLWSR